MTITLEEAMAHVQEEINRPENAGVENEVKDWAIQDLKDNGVDDDIIELVEVFI